MSDFGQPTDVVVAEALHLKTRSRKRRKKERRMIIAHFFLEDDSYSKAAMAVE